MSGYSDLNPPPPHVIQHVEVYVGRIRSVPPRNPKGAAWRLCTILQPRSAEELIRAVWPGDAPTDLAAIVLDEFVDWVNAGKPSIHVSP